MDERADRATRSLRDISRTADRLARRMGGEFVLDQNASVLVGGPSRAAGDDTRGRR